MEVRKERERETERQMDSRTTQWQEKKKQKKVYGGFERRSVISFPRGRDGVVSLAAKRGSNLQFLCKIVSANCREVEPREERERERKKNKIEDEKLSGMKIWGMLYQR